MTDVVDRKNGSDDPFVELARAMLHDPQQGAVALRLYLAENHGERVSQAAALELCEFIRARGTSEQQVVACLYEATGKRKVTPMSRKERLQCLAALLGTALFLYLLYVTG